MALQKTKPKEGNLINNRIFIDFRECRGTFRFMKETIVFHPAIQRNWHIVWYREFTAQEAVGIIDNSLARLDRRQWPKHGVIKYP